MAAEVLTSATCAGCMMYDEDTGLILMGGG